MSKYNFDYELNGKGWGKSDVIIYEKGMVYISRKTIERLGLGGVKLRWGEDKANKILALKKDDKGRELRQNRVANFYCPAEVARRYAGRYNLKEEDGVYVLYPLCVTNP